MSKRKMNRARGLIYVLTTRALRTNGRNFQLIIGYGDRPGDGNHEGCCRAVSCISRLFRASESQIAPS